MLVSSRVPCARFPSRATCIQTRMDHERFSALTGSAPLPGRAAGAVPAQPGSSAETSYYTTARCAARPGTPAGTSSVTEEPTTSRGHAERPAPWHRPRAPPPASPPTRIVLCRENRGFLKSPPRTGRETGERGLPLARLPFAGWGLGCRDGILWVFITPVQRFSGCHPPESDTPAACLRREHRGLGCPLVTSVITEESLPNKETSCGY